jgi:hypothetical protein
MTFLFEALNWDQKRFLMDEVLHDRLILYNV